VNLGGGFPSRYTVDVPRLDEIGRIAAEAALHKLRVTNLYEDAYVGVAQYNYASHWGSVTEQIAGLQRAVAEETGATYLPKPMFAATLVALLPLQVKVQDYAGALAIWDTLPRAGANAQTLAALKPMIDRIQTLRTNDQAYTINGQIVESQWGIRLFKHRFRLAVSQGHVSDIKLLCQRKFVTFKFDPSLQYRVDDHYGDCQFSVAGDAGTRLELTQF